MADFQPTQFAAKLIDLAAAFQYDCGDRHVFIGSKTFAPSLTAPELSTSGGRQMVQHLRLSPLEGQMNPAIVFGTVRQAARAVELRNLEHVISAHAQRTKGSTLEIDKYTFDSMFRAVQEFFERQGYTIHFAEEAPDAAQPPTVVPEKAPSSSKGRLIAAAVGAIAVLSTVAWFVLR